MITHSAAGNEGKLVTVVGYRYWHESTGHVYDVESEGTPLISSVGSKTMQAPVPEKWLAVWPRSLTSGHLGGSK
jgi:hypothetical protein